MEVGLGKEDLSLSVRSMDLCPGLTRVPRDSKHSVVLADRLFDPKQVLGKVQGAIRTDV